MAELIFNPVFQEITCTFKDQSFSAMYFGRHCGKNLVILKHDFTMLLVFGDANQWSTPEMIKTVSFRGDAVKGVEIVGNKDVILLLDECGKLWRLINAFESYSKGNGCLHSLNDSCFYEWIPFEQFNFIKILTVSAVEQGFAFIGLNRNFEKKLAVLPSVDSALEDYTFEELKTSTSLEYHLTSFKVNIQNSVFKNKFEPDEEILLVTDRFNGRTYICGKNGRNCLINQWNICMISALHFPQESCLALCFKNGKFVFYFYDKSLSHCVAYLPKEVAFIKKCFCCETCLLWSDGISLHHTRVSFDSKNHTVKLLSLKLNCTVEGPLSLLLIYEYALTVTVNNIYYFICAGTERAPEILKQPKDLLGEISKHADSVAEYELKIQKLTHYLYCKDIVQKNKVKEKIEMRWESNRLIIKSCLGVCLREQFWKIKLKTSRDEKEFARSFDLECDLNEGMVVKIDNPFGAKCKVRVSLIGDFDGKSLFLDLGEVEGPENDFEKDKLRKEFKKIMKKRNSFYENKTS